MASNREKCRRTCRCDAHRSRDLSHQPVVERTIDDGNLSWLCKIYYNERGEITLDEQAFYGDSFEGFSDTPHYTLITEYSYEYDQYGNWTLMYMYMKDSLQPDELILRNIEYFEM